MYRLLDTSANNPLITSLYADIVSLNQFVDAKETKK